MKLRPTKLAKACAGGLLFGYILGGIKVGVLTMLGIYTFWCLLQALVLLTDHFIETVGEEDRGKKEGS